MPNAVANQKSTDFVEVGNPIQLDYRTDPFHRVTNKIRTFMGFIDLIPVDFSVTVDPFFASGNDRSQTSAANKGVVKYNYDAAIQRFQERCKKYKLKYDYKALRLLTTAGIVFQETIGNEHTDNMWSKTFNAVGSNELVAGMRNYGLSLDSRARDPWKLVGELLGNVKGESADKMRAGMNKVNDQINSSMAGGLGKDVLNSIIFQGRQISLPSIWQSSSYTPQMSLSVKLVSPYGSPKAVRKHIVEPLLYLLLLCSPDTTDGVTYGGNVFLKIKAHGHADINIGYMQSLSISRGGPEVTYNKYGQPLSVELSITLTPAISGFACIAGGEDVHLVPQSLEVIDGCDENGNYIGTDEGKGSDQVFDKAKAPEQDFGFMTVDNIIRSFAKYPGSDFRTNNGEYTSITKVASVANQGRTVLGQGASVVNKGVGMVMSAPSVLNKALNTVIVP